MSVAGTDLQILRGWRVGGQKTFSDLDQAWVLAVVVAVEGFILTLTQILGSRGLVGEQTGITCLVRVFLSIAVS